MVKIIFLRHGYSRYNKTKQYTGQLDIPLEPEGYEQAEDACKYILDTYKVDKIYSSDLSRAVDTVAPLASALGLEINKRKELREINLGKWHNEYIANVPKLYPDDYHNFYNGTGNGKATEGESYEDVKLRAVRFMDEMESCNDGETIVATTHGGFTRAMLWAVLGNETSLRDVPGVANASITVVNYENGKGTVELLGYNEYLTAKEKNTLSE